MDASPRPEDPAREVELSVVVPTRGRPERMAALLERLAAQTLDPARFELIVVDDGSPEPLTLFAQGCRFQVELLRQAPLGPAAARNLGVDHALGRLVLFLNDDAVPAPDLLERHLLAHAEARRAGQRRVAVLGSFEFTRAAAAHPFTSLLDESDLLFDFPGLVDGALHDWRYFWTCNLSLPRNALDEAGGFDATRFHEPVAEDVELGYRLGILGWKVLHRADCRCEHDHVLTADDYFRRLVRLGANLAQVYRKHLDPRVLWCHPTDAVDEVYLSALQTKVEAFWDAERRLVAKLGELERGAQAAAQEAREPLRGLVRSLVSPAVSRGALSVLQERDPEPVLRAGPTGGLETTAIVVSCDQLDATRRCVQALLAWRDPRHPLRVVVVDNGSRDGSREWLAAQPEIELIANDENLGAPRARNQGLSAARGEWIVFLDADVTVTPGWLPRLLYHAEVDGRVGCVGPLTGRAAHGQAIEVPAALAGAAPDERALHAFAAELARERPRRFRYAGLLSSFLLLVRRALVERIGGFDETFSPWGFEDDDFTLRARLAGFRTRIAQDVFVHHAPYPDEGRALERAELLRRNWGRFVDKWGLPADAAHGDYTSLTALAGLSWSRDDLRVPLDGAPRDLQPARS